MVIESETIIMYINMIITIYIALPLDEGQNVLTASTNPAYGVTGESKTNI